MFASAGIGKSTLLGLINGLLEPSRGTVNRNQRVRLATFSQHHVEGMDLALTPLQYMLKVFPGTNSQEMRYSTSLYQAVMHFNALMVLLSHEYNKSGMQVNLSLDKRSHPYYLLMPKILYKDDPVAGAGHMKDVAKSQSVLPMWLWHHKYFRGLWQTSRNECMLKMMITELHLGL